MKKADYTRARERNILLEMSGDTVVDRGVFYVEYECGRQQYIITTCCSVSWIKVYGKDDKGVLFQKDGFVVLAGGVLEITVDPEYQTIEVLSNSCNHLFSEYKDDPARWCVVYPQRDTTMQS